MIEPLINALRDAGFEADHIDVADMLWLAHGMHQNVAGKKATEIEPAESNEEAEQHPPVSAEQLPHATPQKPENITPRSPRSRTQPHAIPTGTFTPVTPQEHIVAPTSPALPERLNIARALRPFKRRRASDHVVELDVEATVRHFADTGFLYPVMRPGKERWFDVALVVDESTSMIVWEDTVNELIKVFDRQGAFRDVHRWSLREEDGRAMVYNDTGLPAGTHNLVDPGGNRLVLMVTDCVAELWYRPKIWRLLQQWGKRTPVAILHMLPTRIWPATGLGMANIAMYGAKPGAPNSAQHASLPFWLEPPHDGLEAVPIPAISLEANAISDWARVTMGVGTGSARSVVKTRVPGHYPEKIEDQNLSADARVEAFRTRVSNKAWQLTTYLSVVPLRLGVMRLVQEAMLPHTGHSELAEFLIGGLVRRVSGEQHVLNGQEIEFEFVDGVREVLNSAVDQAQTLKVYRAIAQHLERTAGSAPGFTALILGKDLDQSSLPDFLRPFVSVSEGVFERVGLRGPIPTTVPPESIADEESNKVDEPAAAEAPMWDAALVVGVSHYQHLDPLDDPAQTATEFGEWLCSSPGPGVPEDRLRVLQNPTDADEIRRALLDLHASIPLLNVQPDKKQLLVLAFFGHTVKGERDPMFCLPSFNPESPVDVFDYHALLQQLILGGNWQRYLCIVDGGPDDMTATVTIDPFESMRNRIVPPNAGSRTGLVLTRKTWYRENFQRTIIDAFNREARDVDGYLRQAGLVDHLADAADHVSLEPGLDVILDDTSMIEADRSSDELPGEAGFGAALIVSSGDEDSRFNAGLITTWLRHPGGFDMNPAHIEQLHKPDSHAEIQQTLARLKEHSTPGSTLFVYLTGTLVSRNKAIYFRPGDRLPEPELEIIEFYHRLRTLGSFSNVVLAVDGQTRAIDEIFPAIPSSSASLPECPGVKMVAQDWPHQEFVRAFIGGFNASSPDETNFVTQLSMYKRLSQKHALDFTLERLEEIRFGAYQPIDATNVQVLSRESTFTCEHGRGVVRLPAGTGPLTLNDLDGAPIDGCTILGDSGKPCTKVVGVGEHGIGGSCSGKNNHYLFKTVQVFSDGAPAQFEENDPQETDDSNAIVLLDKTRFINLAQYDPLMIEQNQLRNVNVKWPIVALSIDLFGTRSGTAILIRRPRMERDNLLMFDVGGKGTWQDVLRPHFEFLASNDDDKTVTLDALALSEMSETNVDAITSLFDDIQVRRKNREQPLLKISDVWYNTAEELDLRQDERGIKIQRPERHLLESLNTLDIGRNLAFGREPVLRRSITPKRIEIAEQLFVTILGPRPPHQQKAKVRQRLSSLHRSGLILLIECDNRLVLLTGGAEPQKIFDCVQDIRLGENGNQVDVLQLPNAGSAQNSEERLFQTEEMLKSVVANQYLVCGNGYTDGAPDITMLKQLLELRQDRPFVVNLAFHPEHFNPGFPIKVLLEMVESHRYAQLLYPEPGETFNTIDLLASLPNQEQQYEDA